MKPEHGVKGGYGDAAHVPSPKSTAAIPAKAPNKAMNGVVNVLDATESQTDNFRVAAVYGWDTGRIPLVVADLVKNLIRLEQIHDAFTQVAFDGQLFVDLSRPWSDVLNQVRLLRLW